MEGDLLVDATVDTCGPQAPDAGDEYMVSVTRYRVIKALEGTYSSPMILVGHARADMSSPAFMVGARHRLSLTRQFPRHSSLLNQFADEASTVGVYFCTSFEVLG
ncbi:hypothetical protein GCM10027053_43290 [Intrasporangium mesophilum]